MDRDDPPAGWYPGGGAAPAWWWWDGRAWTALAVWDGRGWVLEPPPDGGPPQVRPARADRTPVALSQPWVLIFVAGVVLTVVGTAAGIASWHADTVDATGCPTESSITSWTVALWLLGVGIASVTVAIGRRWSARHVGARRFPLEALLVPAAAVLPWVVWVTGFNQCWN